ncbi:MAG TPA: hypothetical protein VFZ21_26460, partial [Gemmatimonadaceae bacterium]|nr:hypothetical protein [Gemmatimonadaceae bacterium]
MSFVDRVYQAAPGWMQSVLLNGYAYQLHRKRFGAGFRSLLAEWDRTQWWDQEKLRAMQDDRVSSLVQFAGAKVPYYARRWAEHGVTLSQVQGVADLKLLPTITKSDIRAAGSEML